MRAIGEGSLYKTKVRGQQYWCAQVVVGAYPNGKQRYARAVRKYRADALAALEELKKQKLNGSVPDRRLTVEMFLRDWLAKEMPQRNKRVKNQKQIKSKFERLVLPVIGKTKLAALKAEDVKNLLDSLMAQGYAPKTVNDVRSHLVTALNHALRYEKVSKNVASITETYTQPRPLNEGLTVAQVNKILIATLGTTYSTLWVIALRLGLRKSEILNLRWENVDLDNEVIKIKDAKTEAGDRDLPLVGKTLEAIKAHYLNSNDTTGYVFLSPTGKRVGDARVNQWWDEILKSVGIEHRTFHGSTRDTITNLMHAAGVPTDTREYILGHGIKGPAKHYFKPTPQALRSALTKYEDFLAE